MSHAVFCLTKRVRLKVVAAPEASAALVVHVSTPAASVQRESEVEAVVLAGIESFTSTPGGTAEGPFFFFNDTATTEIYTLSLHDALPISSERSADLVTVSVSDAELLAGLG